MPHGSQRFFEFAVAYPRRIHERHRIKTKPDKIETDKADAYHNREDDEDLDFRHEN